METIPGSGNSKSPSNVFPLPAYNSALSDKFDILSPLMILQFLKDYCMLDAAVKSSGLDEEGEVQLFRTLHNLCIAVIIESIGNTKSTNLLQQPTGRKSDVKPRNTPNFRSRVSISGNVNSAGEQLSDTPVKSQAEAWRNIQKHQHLHEVPRVDTSAMTGSAGPDGDSPGNLILPVPILVTYINFHLFQKVKIVVFPVCPISIYLYFDSLFHRLLSTSPWSWSMPSANTAWRIMAMTLLHPDTEAHLLPRAAAASSLLRRRPARGTRTLEILLGGMCLYRRGSDLWPH